MASRNDNLETSINDLEHLDDKLKNLLFVKVENSENIAQCYRGWRLYLLADKLLPREERLLICSNCNGVMRDAVHYGKTISCKVCVSAISSDLTVENDYVARNIIQELEIKCPLTEEGCDWTGAIENLTAHFPSCLYYPVPCPLECTVIDNNTAEPVITTLPRHEVESHVTETCPNRQIHCELCIAPIRAGEIHFHMSECLYFPLACPNNCINPQNNETTFVKRGEMNNHVEIECTNVEIDCPFQSNGCFAGKILRKDLATHEQDFMTQHLRLMNRKLEEKDNENSALKAQLEEERSNTEKQIDYLKKFVQLATVTSSFQWTIYNVNEHIDAKSKLKSEPFYACHYQFYCYVQFDCNANEYLGFYTCLIKGDFDNDLRWPASGTYKFCLISQDNSNTNLVRAVKTNVTKHDCFKKPTSAENPGWGIREFFKLSYFKTKNRYCQHDFITLRFQFFLD